jgi:Mg-chelatase subunit ChlD
MMKPYQRFGFCIVVATVFTCQAFAAENIFFILDSSGSMRSEIGGKRKMEIAKEALANCVTSLPDSYNLGLIAYGHRASATREESCKDFEELVELKSGQHDHTISTMELLSPRGRTPISDTLAFATQKLANSNEESVIILISDGRQEICPGKYCCPGDPCQTVRQLKATGPNFRLDVIGLDIEAEEKSQLLCLAREGGGVYTPATDTEGIKNACTRAATRKIFKVQDNIQIVIDASESMRRDIQGHFDEKTPLDVAKSTLNQILGQEKASGRDNIALRRFGGPCEGHNTDLLVDFGLNNATEIRKQINNLDIGGRTTLHHALLKAIDDFQRPTPFEGISQRILALTGGIDACDTYDESLEQIRRQAQERKVQLELRIIGLDVASAEEQHQIEELAKAAHGLAIFVENQDELEDAFKMFFDLEAIKRDLVFTVSSLNTVIQYLDVALSKIQRRDFTEMENLVSKSKNELRSTERALHNISRNRAITNVSVKNIYETANNTQIIQRKILDLLEEANPNNHVVFNKFIQEINASIESYNMVASQMNKALQNFGDIDFGIRKY